MNHKIAAITYEKTTPDEADSMSKFSAFNYVSYREQIEQNSARDVLYHRGDVGCLSAPAEEKTSSAELLCKLNNFVFLVHSDRRRLKHSAGKQQEPM